MSKEKDTISIQANADAEVRKREEQRVLFALVKKDEEYGRFITPGCANCKKGPGDKTGASYAFDIYDFSNGTYRYVI